MTRADMIHGVLAKLEEHSPYQNPGAFTADQGQGVTETIRPVWSYAETTLDEAMKEAVGMLPLRLLHDDITYDAVDAVINEDGVGIVDVPAKDVLRMCELKFAPWERSVTQPIDKTSIEYARQCNPYTRGGVCKPAVVWSKDGGEIWECYSFPTDGTEPRKEPSTRCAYIVAKDHLETLRAAQYAIMLCAIKIHEIYGNTTEVKMLKEELTQMLTLDQISL